jgi:hypothetical protein
VPAPTQRADGMLRQLAGQMGRTRGQCIAYEGRLSMMRRRVGHTLIGQPFVGVGLEARQIIGARAAGDHLRRAVTHGSEPLWPVTQRNAAYIVWPSGKVALKRRLPKGLVRLQLSKGRFGRSHRSGREDRQAKNGRMPRIRAGTCSGPRQGRRDCGARKMTTMNARSKMI